MNKPFNGLVTALLAIDFILFRRVGLHTRLYTICTNVTIEKRSLLISTSRML